MWLSFPTIYKRLKKEKGKSAGETRHEIKDRRQDIYENGGIEIDGDIGSVEELLSQEPGSKPASAATSSGFVVTAEHERLIREADELIEASGGDMDWGTAAQKVAERRHIANHGKLPDGFSWKPRQTHGAPPIGYSEGGPMSASTEQQLSDDAHELAREEGISVIEAVKKIRSQQL